jgi:hypothetical protein
MAEKDSKNGEGGYKPSPLRQAMDAISGHLSKAPIGALARGDFGGFANQTARGIASITRPTLENALNFVTPLGIKGTRLPVKEWENAGWITPEGKLLQYTDEHALMAEDAGETVESLLDQGYAKLHPYAGQLTVGGKSLTSEQKNVLRAIGRLDPAAPVTWEIGDAYGEGLASMLEAAK